MRFDFLGDAGSLLAMLDGAPAAIAFFAFRHRPSQRGRPDDEATEAGWWLVHLDEHTTHIPLEAPPLRPGMSYDDFWDVLFDAARATEIEILAREARFTLEQAVSFPPDWKTT